MSATAYAVLVFKPLPPFENLGIGIFSDPTPNVTPNHYVVVDKQTHADGYEVAAKILDARLKGHPVLGMLYKGLQQKKVHDDHPSIDYKRGSDQRVQRAEFSLGNTTLSILRPCEGKGITLSFVVSGGILIEVGLSPEEFNALHAAINEVAEPAPDAVDLYY